MTVNYNSSVLTPLADSTFGVSLGTVGNSNGGGRTLSVSNPSAGTLVISVFGVTEMQGSGDLINMTFNVNGAIGTSSPLSFASFAYNEGNPCSNATGGTITVVSGTVSGVVIYANAIGTPTPRPVSNVLISGAGSPNVSTTTASGTGAYTLSGFGAGSYTITPTKTGGQNTAISSFDSAKIAQFVAGLTTFSPTQQFVGDVSGNGSITSFDAAEVAAYSVGLFGSSGFSGNWRFGPSSVFHSSITGNVTDNFNAYLMGEVSGNWSDQGPLKGTDALGPERSASAAAPQLVAPADSEVIVPVSVQGAVNKGIISYEFDLRYDSSVIQPQTEAVDLIGTASRGLATAVNASEPGLLRIAVYGATPIAKDGVLLNLRFTAVGASGSVSPLTFERMIFNDGDPGTVTTDGQVELSAAAANDAEISGRVLTALGAGVPNARITLTDAAGQIRSVISNGFGYYRFGGLQVGQTYTISVESRSFKFAPLTASVTGQSASVDLIAQ
jgi:hypothetical protein